MRRTFLPGMFSGGVLSFLIALGTPGCRENPPVSPPIVQPPTAFRWTVGDRMWFDTWALDSNGYTIPSSKCVSLRRVISTGVQFQGRVGVAIMVDSIAIAGQPFRADTAYLSQTSSGDLWQFGLLSSLGQRYGTAAVGPEWDLIAPLSGNSTSWTAGYADTTGSVFGSITTEGTYFSVLIGGVNFVFQTQRVDLSGPTVGYSFWIAQSPPVFAAIIEASSSSRNGIYRILTTAQIAGL